MARYTSNSHPFRYNLLLKEIRDFSVEEHFDSLENDSLGYEAEVCAYLVEALKINFCENYSRFSILSLFRN